MFSQRSELTKDNDDKAVQCKEAVKDLTETEHELYQQRFDNIVANYDSQLAIKDNKVASIEAHASLAETQGYAASTKYAEEIIGIENSRKTSLTTKRDKMQAELDKQVRDGLDPKSETYRNMVADIQAVNVEITKTEENIARLNNEIRQIEWDRFDEGRERIANVVRDSDFLINLMSSEDMYDEDTGEITEHGMATMGLHNANYELYLSEVEKYNDEIKALDDAIAKNPHDTALIKRKEELIEKQQESALAAKAERDAMIDLIEEGINAQLNAMKELIDSYTNALDSQKD